MFTLQNSTVNFQILTTFNPLNENVLNRKGMSQVDQYLCVQIFGNIVTKILASNTVNARWSHFLAHRVRKLLFDGAAFNLEQMQPPSSTADALNQRAVDFESG